MKFKSEKSWQYGLVIWGAMLLMVYLVGTDLIKYGMRFHAGWLLCLPGG